MTVDRTDSARWTESGATRFFSNEAGTGPALICLHGGGPGANAWDNSQYVVEGLARSFHTILLDLPRYGQSTAFAPLEGESDDRMYARALIAFMDARGIASAHLFATSMSTSCALRLALEHPDRVGRLVLKAPAAMPSWFVPFPTPGLVAMFAFMKEQTRDNMEALVRAFVPRKEAFSQDMVEARFEAALRSTPVAPSGVPTRLLDDLGSLEAATLVLAGRDDRMVPFEGALHLLGALRNAQLHVWGGGTGHFPEWEHPAEFVDLVTRFLVR